MSKLKKNKNKKILCFDIDNTICRTKDKKYNLAKPIKEAINKINNLYLKGYYIKIFTARYMGRNNEIISKARKQGFKMTENQLKKWGLNYHKLIFGKPSFDLFIDDKAIFHKNNWHKYINKYIKQSND